MAVATRCMAAVFPRKSASTALRFWAKANPLTAPASHSPSSCKPPRIADSSRKKPSNRSVSLRKSGTVRRRKATHCALAVEKLGIGKQIEFKNARRGDFLQLWRTTKSGHSVVFLEWVKVGGSPIGVKYRSSQPATKGIGDNIEYFANVTGHK